MEKVLNPLPQQCSSLTQLNNSAVDVRSQNTEYSLDIRMICFVSLRIDFQNLLLEKISITEKELILIFFFSNCNCFLLNFRGQN